MKLNELAEMESVQLIYTLIVAKFMSEKSTDICSPEIVNKLMRALFDRESTPSVGELTDSYLTRTPTPELIKLGKSVVRVMKNEAAFAALPKRELRRLIEEIMYPFVVDDSVMTHFETDHIYPDPRLSQNDDGDD